MTTAVIESKIKPRVSIAETIRQSFIMAKRGLIKVRRTPEQLVDVTIQPILFTLMFTYIFGCRFFIIIC
jgi:ABC-2 type transport system permease protein